MKNKQINLYLKDNPIKSAKDMPIPLTWNKIDNEWKENLKKSNQFWFSGFAGKLEDRFSNRIDEIIKILQLRDKLLEFGGEEACMSFIEEDLQNIINRGEFWYGDNCSLIKGEPSRCHSNCAYLWEVNKDKIVICTGYALSKDGMWRQHTWCIETRSGKIIETTVKRIAYFGFVLTVDEAEEFLSNY